jgi:hypothetical protein
MGHDYLTKEYRSWRAMKTRCFWKAGQKWRRYGGRNIKIFAPWIHSFDRFLADMGKAPSPSHSLGRIDNDGNYTPQNCRWETASQQARNKGVVKLSRVEVGEIRELLTRGESVVALGKTYGVSHSLISMIGSGKRHLYVA